MTPDDLVRVRHMIEVGELAMTFVEGRTRGELGSDPMLRMALLHAVQIVGEAASVSERIPELLEQLRAIPGTGHP